MNTEFQVLKEQIIMQHQKFLAQENFVKKLNKKIYTRDINK